MAIMTYVVLVMLNEVRPMWYYVLAAVLFVLSQLDYFLLSKVICRVRCLCVEGGGLVMGAFTDFASACFIPSLPASGFCSSLPFLGTESTFAFAVHGTGGGYGRSK